LRVPGKYPEYLQLAETALDKLDGKDQGRHDPRQSEDRVIEGDASFAKGSLNNNYPYWVAPAHP